MIGRFRRKPPEVKVSAAEVLGRQEIQIDVRVTGVRRVRLGLALVKLGFRVAGCAPEVRVDGTPGNEGPAS